MKQSIENAVQQYLAAWNTKDPSEVKAGFKKCLSANCTYTDKNTPAISGIKGFTDFVAASHKATPGRLFSLRSDRSTSQTKAVISGVYLFRINLRAIAWIFLNLTTTISLLQ